VRFSVSHNRPTEDVKQAIDRSFDDVFKSLTSLPLQLVQEQRSWVGNTLGFSLLAKLGALSTPIKGTVQVTERDVIIDVDFGLLERLIPQQKMRDAFDSRIKGLLK
jgi:hypothetical protein